MQKVLKRIPTFFLSFSISLSFVFVALVLWVGSAWATESRLPGCRGYLQPHELEVSFANAILAQDFALSREILAHYQQFQVTSVGTHGIKIAPGKFVHSISSPDFKMFTIRSSEYWPGGDSIASQPETQLDATSARVVEIVREHQRTRAAPKIWLKYHGKTFSITVCNGRDEDGYISMKPSPEAAPRLRIMAKVIGIAGEIIRIEFQEGETMDLTAEQLMGYGVRLSQTSYRYFTRR